MATPGCAVELPAPADLAPWRDRARALLAAGVPPEQVEWRVAGDPPGLFAAAPPPPPAAAPAFTVPRGFLTLAEVAIRHRDPERFALLYRLLWRLTRGAPGLLHDAADPDLVRLEAMAKSVRRDAHKMHAFLRFREIATPDGPRFLAWFEPEHFIEEAEAGFFARRFAQLRWTIVTPKRTLAWDGEAVQFGPGGRKSDLPAEDAAEDLWRAYFGAIFNPARLKPAAMRAEMPVKYWKNLPEAQDIPRLMAEAPRRVAEMVDRGATPAAPRRQRDIHRTPRVDPAMDTDLDRLRAELAGRNDLPPWTANATQMVFGEGPLRPPLMLIGEQPGDEEDLAGRPFVGPAGRLLDRALAEAGIDRGTLYVTNAVKHFKFTPTGKRRLHQTPDAGDITYYRPFLRREIEIVEPALILALGASAARAITGRPVTISKSRGQDLGTPEGRRLRITVHPSYLLRLPDRDAQAREYARFVEDLRNAGGSAPEPPPG